MFKKTLVIAAASISTLSFAEPQRTQFTHENKFPEKFQLELGIEADYTEFDRRDERSIGPYFRFGLLENLTLNAGVPYIDVDPDLGGESESGFGDTVIGLELRAYEDIFEYPYVIPHVETSLQTGDEDKGLGSGETVTKIGVSLGTVTFDKLHWIVDLSYAVNGGREQPDRDNIFILAGSLVWELNDRFAAILEAFMTDEETVDDNTPGYVQGGFSYDWTENFFMALYVGAGSGSNEDPDGSVSGKFAYTF